MTKTLRMMAGCMLVAMTPFAFAETSGSVDTETQKLNATGENHGQTQVAARIASDFTTLAGSKDNALALVRALRNGTQVTLTSTGATGTTTSTSFTPPTGKMGWGNVFISLALAQSSLAQLGITKPTTAQLQAALMGGTVTRADGTATTLKGVLQLRADGMGWGQIAHSLGTKVGPVVSAIRSTHGKIAQLPTTPSSSSSGTTTATNTPKSTSAPTTASSASPHGKGIVTAAGGSGAGATAATTHAQGKGVTGIVSASGSNASGALSNAGGSGGDNGKGHGKGHGGS